MTAETDGGEGGDGDEDGDAQFTIVHSRNWKWNKGHNVQLDDAGRAAVDDDVRPDEPLLVRNPDNPLEPATFGRLDYKPDRDALDNGTAGIGMNLRYAVGSPVGSSIEVRPFDHDSPPLHRRLFRRLLKIRPVVCRTRKAVHPDIGFQVCRLSGETMSLLGAEPGDRVVVESPDDRTIIKALELTEAHRNKKRRQIEQNADRYPDCKERLDIERLAGTDVDLPPIFLDAQDREQIGLTDCPESGVCQPVRVYRDPVSYFLRSVNDVAVPVVVGLLGLLVVFDEVLALPHMVAITTLAITVVLFSILYTARNVALD